MAEKVGQNEGFRVLEDFICEAQHDAEVSINDSVGRGVNEGMHLISELVVPFPDSQLTEERKTGLRNLAISALITLVQIRRTELGPEELRFIHEIAIERLTMADGSLSKDAHELSRSVMHEAVRRIA